MNHRFIPILLMLATSVLWDGCQHIGGSAANPKAANRSVSHEQVITAQPPPAPNPTANPSMAAALPSEFEDYYVGMIADPDDPSFAYRPGDLIVQTRVGAPRLGGLTGGDSLAFGPDTMARMANDHPEPAEAELSSLALRSERTIAALTEENELLQTQLKVLRRAAPTPAPKDQGAQASAPTPTITASAKIEPQPDPVEDEHLNLLTPNSDNVIEIDPNLFVAPVQTTNNPFVQLYQPPVTTHEIELVVSAAIPGPNPSAIINDVACGVGDRIKEFTVSRIESDTVYLRKDSFLLACPVSEKTLKVRLP